MYLFGLHIYYEMIHCPYNVRFTYSVPNVVYDIFTDEIDDIMM